MSSILDALRKLEEEKAQEYSAPKTPLPIEPPAREPALRRTRRSSRRTRDGNRKLWIAVPVGIFALGVIWAAVAIGPPSGSDAGDANVVAAADTGISDPSGEVVHRDPSLERLEADLRQIAESPLREAPATVSDASLSEPIPQPIESQTNQPAPPAPVADEPAKSAVDAKIVSVRTEPIRVDVKPIPIESETEPEPVPEPLVEPEPPVEETAPELIDPEPIQPEPVQEVYTPVEEELAPRPEPSERYQRAMAASNALIGETTTTPEPAPVEEDIRRYAILTDTERVRLGIPELVLNVLGTPNKRHPQGFALINYNSVYVGEAIPETQGRAQLIGVDVRGIAVEVDGERFYYPK